MQYLTEVLSIVLFCKGIPLFHEKYLVLRENILRRYACGEITKLRKNERDVTQNFTKQFFLSLLDYVSRGHGTGLLSARVGIISEPNVRISFKFHLWLLLDYIMYLQRHFFISS